MKKKQVLIILTLLFVVVIEAGVVTATIEQAETGQYDEINGKKLIFYDNENAFMSYFTIQYWNVDNTSQVFTETLNFTGQNKSSCLYTIKPDITWNCTYAHWEVNIDGTKFEGGFPTKGVVTENAIEDLKDDLQYWLINNDAYNKKFEDVETGVTTAVDALISSYNEGLIASMQEIGLTPQQITEIMDSVSGGFESTLKTKNEQTLEVVEAKNQGFWDGVKLVSIFLVVIIAITLYSLAYKGYLRIPSIHMNRNKNKAVVTPVSKIDLSGFNF